MKNKLLLVSFVLGAALFLAIFSYSFSQNILKPNYAGAASTTTSTTNLAIEAPTKVFSTSPQYNNTILVDKNQLVFQTMVVPTNTYVQSLSTEVEVPPKSFTSQIIVGLYFNGSLSYQKTQRVQIEAAPGVKTSPQYGLVEIDFPVLRNLSALSTISIAILPDSPVYLFQATGSASTSAVTISNQTDLLTSVPSSSTDTAALPVFYWWAFGNQPHL